jgi:hypothetical protein
MTQVKWGFMQFKADPEKVWREIQQIGDQYTPQDVLEYARDPQTELHKCFDWDNTTAAEKWRKQQARWVCNSLVVTIIHEDQPTREFRVIQHDAEDRVYRPVVLTVQNKEQYGRLLDMAKRELKAFKDRYAEIVELRNVIEEIERILK